MIQPCTIEDKQALQHIAYQTFDETFRAQNKKENIDHYLKTAFTDEKVERELSNPHSFFYFIFHEEQLAGYLKLNIKDAQTEPFDEHHLEIERIYILKQFQKHGLGQSLYQHALQKARALSCEHIWLGVWEKNTNAIDFYQKMGFMKVDQHAFFMGDDEQIDIIMLKNI
ncbi:N-acetyltransferase [Macrococcoides caseolyticum subsp. caseolyticum]|uniref:GNAT family N-acetyltransferase n=1 Tax=Macrococcoides caseolyticum TaxID=69966 RepID=UPI000CD07895|nr:GNAT family N-acetyltransferase [Macrococcus caseolyticus]PNZ74873.1 GNAT family N-acetyltransferase [Macrococcus caseolyticus]QPT46071.1 GNAT family N-acetyltransferase [Macrococcus caseolyticus]RAK45556.1 N-acetyltransferase [Macrococcus caseolyticus subsp. caseolyticus]HCD18942.1 N-acetyltransferase [Macrococcus caseolyticus]